MDPLSGARMVDERPPECGNEWAMIFALVIVLLLAGTVIGASIIGPALRGH